MLTLSGALVMGFSPPLMPQTAALPALIGAAVFATLGYAALTTAMRTGDVATVTPFRYTRLIFAMIFVVALFGESPTPITLIGAGLIVACGVALMPPQSADHGQPRR
jgi:drug/metabolite transporter (DMT)-like permease